MTPDYRDLIRECFRSGGYAYAKRADEVIPGSGGIARLASNENPEPPSEEALRAGTGALAAANRYPDERMSVLQSALMSRYGPYHFVTGVGMDGVIETVVRCLVEAGERVAISTPTFSFYRLAAIAAGADVREVPRGRDFAVDPAGFIREAAGAKLAFLCTPNNPTGTATPPDVIEQILGKIPGVLFLDCAYVEYSAFDYVPLMNRHKNLIIGRTFSKAYSLAGLRVGYAFVPDWLPPFYQRAATPHTLNSVSSSAAAAALGDPVHVDRAVRHVASWRERIVRECRLPVLPSDANFVMVDVSPHSSDEAVDILAGKGALVRSCQSFRGLSGHFIRVSIGEDWEMEQFLSAVNSL